jgi:hypothetical protein
MSNVYETETEIGIHSELEAELEDELGAAGEFEEELEDEAEYEDESEYESEEELESEEEWEAEISPIRKVYPDAMMEHLGALAAESESEDEAAEHFLPLIGMAASKLLPLAVKAIAPMAKKALPRVIKAVTRVTPHLTRGVARIARTIHRRPGARPLLRAMPAIARDTVHSLARQAIHRRPITPRVAVRTLAQHTRHILRNPRRRRHALRRNRHLDRRFHWRWGRGVVAPHLRHTYAGIHRGGVAHPGVAHPGVAVSAPGRAGRSMRVGRTVGGQCVCSACPTCGVSQPAAAQPTVVAPPAPSYCRCCGQVIR